MQWTGIGLHGGEVLRCGILESEPSLLIVKKDT